ncbi:MAG TPA: DNA gyrase subunit A [Candidatus Nanoarchaeia archaeon]|nr:DNA gyrase subunit A [Candidatus Nanoarchaeia archaeon]
MDTISPPVDSTAQPGVPPIGAPGEAGFSSQIIPRIIEQEMKEAYVTYAMSVIVGRALPDVRDGLKPVHRRILYAMYDLGMLHTKPFKKCARIVGEVLGKYHPHGDMAVYDALVRMAQDFSLRYPLIAGQGNFGSIDGDNAASMRYTEARLSKIAEEMLKDLEKETVAFRENFDSSLKEPEVLPSVLPNLLVNGSSGIAVGMATNIPPHNLKEVCQALIALIENPALPLAELLGMLPAPDFPTGGEVLCGNGLLQAYSTGRGKVTIKAVSHMEGDKIIFTEIPYQVGKEDLIKQIADLVQNKTITGIRNINDESDREGIRMVIDLKKDADPQVVLNQLHTYSRLKVSFGITLLALVDNQPRVLGIRDMLQHHVTHRHDVITRRTQYDLQQALQRVHILEGLLLALAHIEDIIAGIKKQRTAEEAREFLMATYSLSLEQAKAILDMRLQRLASLEQEKIKEEHGGLLLDIENYRSILGSEQRLLDMIKDELRFLAETYGDERRSRVMPGDDDEEAFDMEALIPDEQAVVTMTHSGYMKRLLLGTYKVQHRGGKGVKAAGTKEEDVVSELYVASTHDYLLCFTDQGQLYWLKVYQVPEASRQATGKHVANLLSLSAGEKVTAVIPVRDFTTGYLIMATKKGIIKKTALEEFSRPRQGGIRALFLEEDDSLVHVRATTGDKEILLATKNGSANRFSEKDVRPMGRTAYGVRGIRLDEGDAVMGMITVAEGLNILTITEQGYGKRTPVAEYRLCRRGGKGVTNIKITEKNGPVKAVMLVDGKEGLMLVSQQGQGIRIRCSEVPIIGRATQGVRVMRLDAGDKVAAAAKILGEEAAESPVSTGEVTV